MNNVIREYLTQRFLRNNHTKYYKYCNDWIDNVTEEQLNYFIKEKDKLNF